MMREMSNLKALFMVINAGFSDEVIELARKAGASGATIINARGEGAIHKSFLGISVDSEKEMVVSLVSEEVAQKIMMSIKEQSGITTPAHTVCFTLPVEKMIGMRKETVVEE